MNTIYYFQLEPMKFNKGIKWLQTILFNMEISKEEFSKALSKALNKISFLRKHVEHMLKDILHNMIYNKKGKFVF